MRGSAVRDACAALVMFTVRAMRVSLAVVIVVAFGTYATRTSAAWVRRLEPVSPRARLLAAAGAGQALGLAAALVVVRAVGSERAGLAPARSG